MARPILRTSLCDLLGSEYPIMLAGMGSEATTPELVAAVNNAGGFGMDGVTEYPVEKLREEIRQIRELTDKPFGLDILLPASRVETPPSRDEVRERIKRDYPKHWAWVQELHKEYDLPDAKDQRPGVGVSSEFVEEQVRVIIEERIPLFAAALGDPSWLVPRFHEAGIKVLGMAGSARNALRQKKAGVDIVVAQGYEAGGHTGRVANFVLIPEVMDAVAPTPVVAAGAVADGRTIAASLSLGAVGVWCGTAFLFASENAISEGKRAQLLQGSTEDFIVTRAYTGKTARDYKNPVIDRWEQSGLEALPMPLQGVLTGDFAEAARIAGRWDLVNNPAGQVAGRLKKIKPAKQIVEDMVLETIKVLQGLQQDVTVSAAT
jgi:nitronate monooxygenase